MAFAELFAHAVTALPEAVRRRMDRDAPLDWEALGDPDTGTLIDEAVRGGRRLPEPVETLAARLIREVGVVPADLAAGLERERAANAWSRRIAVEPDGLYYRLRNRGSGEVHAGIRPEALAGYAVLSLDLATAAHEASELWIEAGDRCAGMTDDGSSPLMQCAIRIGARLKPVAETDAEHGSTGTLAGTLEDAWNALGLEVREEICAAIQPGAAPGARAPRRRHYAPAGSYRVHAYDPGEIRWLRALGERARDEAPPGERPEAVWLGPDTEPTARAAGANGSAFESRGDRTGQAGTRAGAASTAGRDPDPDELGLGRELAELQRATGQSPPSPGPGPALRTPSSAGSGDAVASLELTALEARVQAEAGNSLKLGSRADEIVLDEALAGLGRAVARLPAAIRRRLGDSHGIGLAQALARLRDPDEADAVLADLRSAVAARQAPAWLEELASSLLADTGAQTRDGRRTGSLSLDFSDGPDGYLATEIETGIQGKIALPALLEQLRLGLTFAEHAWTGLKTLRTAGTEGGWTIEESLNGTAGLSATEREMLEAARQIDQALRRTRYASLKPDRPLCALEHAAMTAEAIGAVGPTVRAAAGWPGAAEAPDPRDPEDVARVAAFAGTLHEAVKSISDRTIAGGMAARANGAEA